MIRPLVLLLVALVACTPRAPDADPAALGPVARRYVVLALGLGRHDAAYVDAWYGPDSLKAIADRDSLGVPAIRAAADSLLTILGDSTPPYAGELVRLRHAYLRRQLQAMVAHARRLAGERFTFDQEAEALYAVTPTRFTDAHFDSLLGRLDTLLAGPGPLATRYQRFREGVNIPPALVDTVFKRAIAACRARTLAHVPLPANERFDLEYVKGTSWNAYNWYKGDARSVIQVNLDFPIAVDRAVDLACHEGYPGHHVYNALLEQTLVRDSGWVEFSVYPLFSPQSYIAEGSANYGIDMAFPGEARTTFERDSLFPLAGLDTALAGRNAEVRRIMERLNYARNEVARRYLEGTVDSAGAVRAMERYWLQAPDAAAKTLRFITNYRSYVINYNQGRDDVARWVEGQGNTPDLRWEAFRRLLASPRLAPDLK